MNEHVSIELVIDMLMKAGMEEYEAIALVCQLLEEEAGDYLFWGEFYRRNLVTSLFN